MITNPEIISNKYACKSRYIAEYLIFKCHVPLLGFDKNYFYFTNNEILQKYLKQAPLKLKIALFSNKVFSRGKHE